MKRLARSAPFGGIVLVMDEAGRLVAVEPGLEAPAAEDWPCNEATRLVDAVLAGRPSTRVPALVERSPAWLALSPFAREVLVLTAAIAPGTIQGYGEIARRMGRRPQDARAVAGALARNPFPVLVPCHRVGSAAQAATQSLLMPHYGGAASGHGAIGSFLRALERNAAASLE